MPAPPETEPCLSRSLRVESVDVSWFRIPTTEPESDGSLEWDHTTLVVVEIAAGGCSGLGYTYTHEAAAVFIRSTLIPILEGAALAQHPMLWHAMNRSARNVGQEGLAATAISAVDVALWDLRCRLYGVRVVDLLGHVRASVPIYGSGGFTSYDEAVLCRQLGDWVDQGITAVKMKVGRDPATDLKRVRAARAAIGDDAVLMVDANNAYTAKQAVFWAHRFHDEAGMAWLEQPVPDEAVSEMAFVRAHAPPAVEVTDGEYGFSSSWFVRRLEAGAADVLMPDITRCLGLTGFLKIAALCEAACVPISSHCAPSLHATAGCLVEGLRHCEYFIDHVRIEQAVFEGAAVADAQGHIAPDPGRAGFGLEFKRRDAECMAQAHG